MNHRLPEGEAHPSRSPGFQVSGEPKIGHEKCQASGDTPVDREF